MKRTLLAIFLIYLLILFQTINLPWLEFFFVRPNFLLIYCLILIHFFALAESVLIGFWAGFLLDVFSQNFFFYAGVFPLFCFCWWNIKNKFFEDNFFTTVSAVSIFTFFLTFFEFSYYAKQVFPWIIFLVQPVMNAVFVPVVYPLCKTFASNKK